jgi:hypothetical protein
MKKSVETNLVKDKKKNSKLKTSSNPKPVLGDLEIDEVDYEDFDEFDDVDKTDQNQDDYDNDEPEEHQIGESSDSKNLNNDKQMNEKHLQDQIQILLDQNEIRY